MADDETANNTSIRGDRLLFQPPSFSQLNSPNNLSYQSYFSNRLDPPPAQYLRSIFAMRSINAYTLAALGASTAHALPASQRNTVSTNSHWGVGNGFTNGDALNKRNSVIDLDPNNPALRPIDPPFEVLCPEVCSTYKESPST